MAERNAALAPEAEAIQQRYLLLFTGYASCRSLFNHSSAVSDEIISSLEQKIKSFLNLCRMQIVQRQLGHITTKLHLLEDHTVPALRCLHVGLALLAKQESESIHAKFNTFNRQYQSIRENLKRLNAVVEQHFLSTLPQNDDLQPSASNRRKN